MECPCCYQIYEDPVKQPKNLPCGHTYCLECLKRIYDINKYLKCPNCRTKFDSTLLPTDLSKNFVAAQLAAKQLEIRKKLLFCEEHEEPLRFFCETCQTNICPQCIIDHSGHKFLKQEHSAQLLKQKVDKVNSALNKKIKAVTKMKMKNQARLQNYEKVKKKELEKLEKEFKKLLTNLKERKTKLKKEFLQFYEEETKGLLTNIETQGKIIKDLNKNMKSLKKLSNELSNSLS